MLRGSTPPVIRSQNTVVTLVHRKRVQGGGRDSNLQEAISDRVAAFELASIVWLQCHFGNHSDAFFSLVTMTVAGRSSKCTLLLEPGTSSNGNEKVSEVGTGRRRPVG